MSWMTSTRGSQNRHHWIAKSPLETWHIRENAKSLHVGEICEAERLQMGLMAVEL